MWFLGGLESSGFLPNLATFWQISVAFFCVLSDSSISNSKLVAFRRLHFDRSRQSPLESGEELG